MRLGAQRWSRQKRSRWTISVMPAKTRQRSETVQSARLSSVVGVRSIAATYAEPG